MDFVKKSKGHYASGEVTIIKESHTTTRYMYSELKILTRHTWTLYMTNEDLLKSDGVECKTLKEAKEIARTW